MRSWSLVPRSLSSRSPVPLLRGRGRLLRGCGRLLRGCGRACLRAPQGFGPLVRRGQRLVPRLRVAVTAVVGLSFASILLVGAYVSGSFAPEGGGEDGDFGNTSVPASILGGGPIVNAAPNANRSYSLPPRTMALTFDDGPDRRWTPAVLAVLRKHRVPGTFFVLGELVTREPDITRKIVADGHEIGLHTFTHPDLSKIASWRRGMELSLTQLAVAGTTGRMTSLVREPYSSMPSYFDNNTWPVVRDVGTRGYLTVVTDTDSRDWDEHDTSAIIQNAAPTGAQGAIVLWHDAGGDRSRTVAALDRFIPEMRAKGYQFTTVSEGLRLALGSKAEADAKVAGLTPAPASVIWRGRLLMLIVGASESVLDALWVIFIAVGVMAIARTLMLFFFAGQHVRRRRAKDWCWGPPVAEPVSVLVPAYNEKEGIAAAVRSLANGDYPNIEVIVVDDGSTDGTGDIVESLGLPNVRLIRIPNGGKPGALNTGIANARYDIVVMVDGDTVFERETIRRLVQPFADPSIGAVSGNVKIGNRDGVLGRWQHIEYVIGFNLDRRLYDTLRCMPTVPGAVGAFRRAALREVGGVSGDTLAEDTDLTMALCRAGWRVVYEESARAWTEAPTSLGQLQKQRYRWSYGTMQAMWKHRRALLERNTFGRLGLPLLALFGVALPLLAPVFDVLALFSLFAFDGGQTVLAWCGMLALQSVTAVVAFRLDHERLRPLWALPLQQFVYRQLMYLVAIQSVISAVTGVRLSWHKLRRVGLTIPTEPARPNQTVMP